MNGKMIELGSNRSAIREIFEYAKTRAAEVGAENVYDFSIGNPSVPAPALVNETIEKLLRETPSEALHGYTSAQGDKLCRDKIAENLNKRFHAAFTGDSLYFTCGAAASLTISLRALTESADDEFTFSLNRFL